MSDLFSHPALIASRAWYLVPGLVLVASLLGSTHCVGMCGGIAMALPPGRRSQAGYHIGRLAGYLGLGALAGLAGDWLLARGSLLTQLSAVAMALMLVWTASRIWRGRPLHLSLPATLQKPVQLGMGLALGAARGSAGKLSEGLPGLAVGLLTVFLPCGWLYTFVIGALMTRNLWLGAAYLFCFWLGTVPLLAIGPALVNSWLGQRSATQRRFVALLFLSAGLLTIGLKAGRPLPVSAEHLRGIAAPAACHGGPQVSDMPVHAH